jgi:hypothetical protein
VSPDNHPLHPPVQYRQLREAAQLKQLVNGCFIVYITVFAIEETNKCQITTIGKKVKGSGFNVLFVWQDQGNYQNPLLNLLSPSRESGLGSSVYEAVMLIIHVKYSGIWVSLQLWQQCVTYTMSKCRKITGNYFTLV